MPAAGTSLAEYLANGDALSTSEGREVVREHIRRFPDCLMNAERKALLLACSGMNDRMIGATLATHPKKARALVSDALGKLIATRRRSARDVSAAARGTIERDRRVIGTDKDGNDIFLKTANGPDAEHMPHGEPFAWTDLVEPLESAARLVAL